MTFEELMKANAEIQTTDIKGKDYAEVNQRIKAFRMLHPNGSIQTMIKSLENGVCVMQAIVFDADGKILGTGHAYEKEGSTFINKTSYIENCETSAVGRALGMCGIGIDTSVASYEEVANAITQQESENIENMRISEVKVKALMERCKNDGVPEEKIMKLYRVSSLAELTEKKFVNINTHWEEIKKA